MRTLLLASALVVLAACSDNQQPTAPRSASSRGSAAGDVAPVGQGIKLHRQQAAWGDSGNGLRGRVLRELRVAPFATTLHAAAGRRPLSSLRRPAAQPRKGPFVTDPA